MGSFVVSFCALGYTSIYISTHFVLTYQCQVVCCHRDYFHNMTVAVNVKRLTSSPATPQHNLIITPFRMSKQLSISQLRDSSVN